MSKHQSEPTRPPRRRGRPSRDDDYNVKEALLNAAVDLFSERGFRSVTLLEISTRAGAANGIVRHHFGSKDALIDAANAQVLDGLIRMFEVLTQKVSATNNDLLENWREQSVDIIPPKIKLLYYLRWIILESPEDAEDFFDQYFAMVSQLLLKITDTDTSTSEHDHEWLVWEYIFIQLGPIFLNDLITARIGTDPYAPEIVEARSRQNARLFSSIIPKPGNGGSSSSSKTRKKGKSPPR